MKLINPSVREITYAPTVDAMYNAIRDAAATCYQTDTEKMKLSPEEFVNKVLLANGHTRPLEFGTVYLLRWWVTNPDMSYFEYKQVVQDIDDWKQKYENNAYSRVQTFCQLGSDETTYRYVAVTTNFRVIMQGDYVSDQYAHKALYNRNWTSDLMYWPTLKEFNTYEHMFFDRRTFVMDMSRGCTDDFRTHISLSSMCESTRFCNYSNGRFGNELTFVTPYWIDNDTVFAYNDGKCDEFIAENPDRASQMEFLKLMERDEKNYLAASKMGLQPQQLKRLFPLGAKAELRLCGFNEAWDNFFWRRSDNHADPECKFISDQIKSIYY